MVCGLFSIVDVRGSNVKSALLWESIFPVIGVLSSNVKY